MVLSAEYGESIFLRIFENGLKEKNIGIILPSDECSAFDSMPVEVSSMYINGKKVQMLAQCIYKGIKMDYPKTSAGQEYVINEFKNKNKVIYKQNEMSITFSARGFINSYNSFESPSGGL